MKDAVVLEESSKNNVGRPRKYSKESLNKTFMLMPEIKTERGIIEFQHQCHSFSILIPLYEKNPAGNRWAEYYIDKNHKHIFHSSILAALGRIEDEDVLISFAKEIADHKISTIQAVSTIRRHRLNKTDHADRLQLFLHLEKSVNLFLQKHPSASIEMIVSCLYEYAELLEADE